MTSRSSLPLAGMRVLDLTRALAGPFCTQVLADLGADIVKVEPMPGGDMIRTWGPFVEGQRDDRVSAYFLCSNRNKRSLALNFRSDEGRAILRAMALKSDVLVENFTPGTLAAMGLDGDALREENPALITASISGFGATGPLAERPGFDQIAQGYSGVMSVTGAPESGPSKVGIPVGDMTAGLWLAIGILSAWAQRKETGLGQTVETSLLAALVGLLSVQGQRYLSSGEVPTLAGNHHPVIAPYGAFRTKDGDINIGAATQDMWLAVCTVIGRPDLARDPRFKDNAARVTHREELRALIEAELARKTRAEWSEALIAAKVPAGPINTIQDALESDQIKHLGLIEAIAHPDVGILRQVTTPVKFSGHDGGWVRTTPPAFGEHSRAILNAYSFNAGEIDAWEKSGVIQQAKTPGET